MKATLLLPLFFSLFIAGISSCTNVNRKPEIFLSLHQEGAEQEGEKFVQPVETPQGIRFFRKFPEIQQDNLEAFQVLPQERGQGNVVALKFDALGTRKLYDLSLQKMGRGEYLLLFVNGRAKDFFLVNSPIEDGVLILWGGLQVDELIKLQKEVEHNNK